MNIFKYPKTLGFLVALWLLFLFGMASVAWAETLEVPSARYDTLQEAIDDAGPGDEIVITTSQTFRENIKIRNKRRIKIRTELTSRKATIQARRDTDPTVTITSSSDITFENIIITGGAVGVTAENSSKILFKRCEIRGNKGVGLSGTGLSLDNSTVTENATWGLELTGEVSATITASTISKNPSGGISVRSATLEMQGSTLDSNGTYGLEVLENGTATLVETTITGHPQGGVHVASGATATLGGTIKDNQGAGALAEGATLNLAQATVSGHPEGGLIYRDATGQIEASRILSNAKEGVLLVNSQVQISGSEISSNAANGIFAT
ncbi:MAG: right-handed parallel beta-helix repeat-containing protein, partial [Candidatus Bipolaricaulia bacterium]